MAWLAAAALVFVLGLLLAESRQANRRLKSRLAALEAPERNFTVSPAMVAQIIGKKA